MPRTDVLDYYVSLRRADPAGTRTALLAGPFATHTEALAMVDRAKDEAERADPRAFWDAHGTCSLPRDVGNPFGKLNQRLGVVPRLPY
jgi:hypothetical protein